jgi:hypothetical protein
VSLAGCTRTVAMTDPSPAANVAAVCGDLMAALPSRVLDEKRRTVRPGARSAAWGDPTITLRCGVDPPPSLNAGSQCIEVNGVGWFTEEVAAGYLFTTIGRVAYVEVAVPRAYAPEANALVDLADAVGRTVPQQQACL